MGISVCASQIYHYSSFGEKNDRLKSSHYNKTSFYLSNFKFSSPILDGGHYKSTKHTSLNLEELQIHLIQWNYRGHEPANR